MHNSIDGPEGPDNSISESARRGRKRRAVDQQGEPRRSPRLRQRQLQNWEISENGDLNLPGNVHQVRGHIDRVNSNGAIVEEEEEHDQADSISGGDFNAVAPGRVYDGGEPDPDSTESESQIDGEAQVNAESDSGREYSDDEFFCIICYEFVPTRNEFSLEACKVWRHCCCEQCARHFFKCRIFEGLLELKCPVGMTEYDSCGPAIATYDEVKRVLDFRDAYVYQRLLRKAADQTLCECPNCEILCKSSVATNCVQCPDCGELFCKLHAWSHRSESEKEGDDPVAVCAAFERKLQQEQSKNEIDFNLKPCPSCKAETEMGGGCNHMTCRSCKADWCWICGLEIDGNDVAWHYSEENSNSGCLRYFDSDEHPPVKEVRLERWWRHFQQRRLRRWLWYVGLPVRMAIYVWATVIIIVAMLTRAPHHVFFYFFSKYFPVWNKAYERKKGPFWTVVVIGSFLCIMARLIACTIMFASGVSIPSNVLLMTLSALVCIMPGASIQFEKLKSKLDVICASPFVLVAMVGVAIIGIAWVVLTYLVIVAPLAIWLVAKTALVKVGFGDFKDIAFHFGACRFIISRVVYSVQDALETVINGSLSDEDRFSASLTERFVDERPAGMDEDEARLRARLAIANLRQRGVELAAR